MLTNSQSTIEQFRLRKCDGVLFVERTGELLLASEVKRQNAEPQRKRVLIGRQ
jgi:sensor domain CHASE-containing protein